MAAWDQGRSLRTRSKFVAQRRKTPSKKRGWEGERYGGQRTVWNETDGTGEEERTTYASRYAQETTRGGVAMSLEVVLARNRVYLRAHTRVCTAGREGRRDAENRRARVSVNVNRAKLLSFAPSWPLYLYLSLSFSFSRDSEL